MFGICYTNVFELTLEWFVVLDVYRITENGRFGRIGVPQDFGLENGFNNIIVFV